MDSKMKKFILDNQESLSKEDILALIKKTNETLYYTATEVGTEIGISKTRVGTIANNFNVKKEEYGKWVMDPGVHGREYVNFRYNEKGKQRISELYHKHYK